MTGPGRHRRLVPVHRSGDDDAGILPLINVVFLLLVFFMAAGQLAPPDPFPVDPAQSAQAGSADAGRGEILMDANGRLALDGEIMTEADLLARLAARGEEQTPLRLRADGAVAAADLIALVQRIQAAAAREVTLVTAPDR